MINLIADRQKGKLQVEAQGNLHSVVSEVADAVSILVVQAVEDVDSVQEKLQITGDIQHQLFEELSDKVSSQLASQCSQQGITPFDSLMGAIDALNSLLGNKEEE